MEDATVHSLKRKIVKDSVHDLIKDLRSMKDPEYLTEDGVYNLLQFAVTMMICSGKSPEQVNELLHKLTNEAINDFIKQLKFPPC